MAALSVKRSIGSEEKQGQRGPGFRKFNKSLLENEEFVLKMKSMIINAKQKYKDVTDARNFWEILKMEIRIFFIRFTEEKAKDKRNTEQELLRKLENLNAQTDASPNDDHLVSATQTLKIKLDQIAEQNTKRFIVRRRNRWYESGEKCNKHFFDLSKRSYNKKPITKLKHAEGSVSEDTKVILNEMRNFYEQLWLRKATYPLIFHIFSTLNCRQGSDNVKQSLCEGPITEEECLSALKSLQSNKTTGTVGLSAVFTFVSRMRSPTL